MMLELNKGNGLFLKVLKNSGDKKKQRLQWCGPMEKNDANELLHHGAIGWFDVFFRRIIWGDRYGGRSLF